MYPQRLAAIRILPLRDTHKRPSSRCVGTAQAECVCKRRNHLQGSFAAVQAVYGRGAEEEGGRGSVQRVSADGVSFLSLADDRGLASVPVIASAIHSWLRNSARESLMA
jgi:hypothetical protein